MYIHPFVCGVVSTIFVEIVVLFVAAVIVSFKNKNK